MNEPTSDAGRIALLYALAAGAWILLSDAALAAVAARVGDQGGGLLLNSSLQTAKGWAFVLVTAALLFLLLRAEFSRRLAANRELEESHRRLDTLIDNLPGMVYRCRNDEDWTMEFVSDGALPLTGYRADDLLAGGRVAFADLIHADDRDRVWQQVQDAVSRVEPFELTYRIRNADGEWKTVWERGRGVHPESGFRLEGFITDISDRIGH